MSVKATVLRLPPQMCKTGHYNRHKRTIKTLSNREELQRLASRPTIRPHRLPEWLNKVVQIH